MSKFVLVELELTDEELEAICGAAEGEGLYPEEFFRAVTREAVGR